MTEYNEGPWAVVDLSTIPYRVVGTRDSHASAMRLLDTLAGENPSKFQRGDLVVDGPSEAFVPQGGLTACQCMKNKADTASKA